LQAVASPSVGPRSGIRDAREARSGDWKKNGLALSPTDSSRRQTPAGFSNGNSTGQVRAQTRPTALPLFSETMLLYKHNHSRSAPTSNRSLNLFEPLQLPQTQQQSQSSTSNSNSNSSVPVPDLPMYSYSTLTPASGPQAQPQSSGIGPQDTYEDFGNGLSAEWPPFLLNMFGQSGDWDGVGGVDL